VGAPTKPGLTFAPQLLQPRRPSYRLTGATSSMTASDLTDVKTAPQEKKDSYSVRRLREGSPRFCFVRKSVSSRILPLGQTASAQRAPCARPRGNGMESEGRKQIAVGKAETERGKSPDAGQVLLRHITSDAEGPGPGLIPSEPGSASRNWPFSPQAYPTYSCRSWTDSPLKEVCPHSPTRVA